MLNVSSLVSGGLVVLEVISTSHNNRFDFFCEKVSRTFKWKVGILTQKSLIGRLTNNIKEYLRSLFP